MKIIAYGSLMNQQSLEKTLRRPAQLNKVTVPGYKRVFNAPFDGYAFLNLSVSTESVIEATYFTLKKGELKLFDVREAGSELIEVMPGYFAFVWPMQKCQRLPVLQSYISLCEMSANLLDIDFYKGLIWPETIVIDTENPIYVT